MRLLQGVDSCPTRQQRKKKKGSISAANLDNFWRSLSDYCGGILKLYIKCFLSPATSWKCNKSKITAAAKMLHSHYPGACIQNAVNFCTADCVAKCKKFKQSSYLPACPPLVCLLYAATGEATGCRCCQVSGRSRRWQNQAT